MHYLKCQRPHLVYRENLYPVCYFRFCRAPQQQHNYPAVNDQTHGEAPCRLPLGQPFGLPFKAGVGIVAMD